MLALHNRVNTTFRLAEAEKTRNDGPVVTQETLLTVAAVARRIGVAPATLRTWDRRYGLGPSLHEAGQHRRYCPSDLSRLMFMRRLISAGASPCDAAEKARAYTGTTMQEEIAIECQSRDDLVALLHGASKRCDILFIERELRKDLAAYGVTSSWSHVIVPVLTLLGRDWELAGIGIEVEHLFSEIIKGILRESVGIIDSPLNSRPVLLAAVGEEQHCLAVHALVAALAERRIETIFLGARTPLEALCGVVNRSAPPAIFLWAQLRENAEPEFFRDLPAVRPAPRIVLGGPGWDRELCGGAIMVEDLAQACSEIERAVGL